MKLPTVAEYKKGLTAFAGLLVSAISLGVLHGTVLSYAILASTALTAIGVVAVKNVPPKPPA